jgi:hypothetical protein
MIIMVNGHHRKLIKSRAFNSDTSNSTLIFGCWFLFLLPLGGIGVLFGVWGCSQGMYFHGKK